MIWKACVEAAEERKEEEGGGRWAWEGETESCLASGLLFEFNELKSNTLPGRVLSAVLTSKFLAW